LPVKNKLPRKNSLKSKLEIDRLLKKGNKLSGDCFLLFWTKTEEFAYAVLVGRKLGNAVQRNRIKRLFKESIRTQRQKLPAEIKLAILPNVKSTKVTFEQINAEFSRIFDKINALA
jgi:ribonuclease P protein component